MILVDKNIKDRANSIFKENYVQSKVQSTSYDLTTDTIIVGDRDYKEYSLKPNETVLIKTKEKISMPSDLIGWVLDKNSRIRLGLTVTSPIYQPGHTTYIYFRLQNVSQNEIVIRENDELAQIMFEQLATKPNMTYDKKPDASFNNELRYKGYGNYKDEFAKRIEKFEELNKDLEKREGSIYANILTMMGIFVSIFSLITINFSNISSENFNDDLILKMNLSLGIIITLFLGLIFLFVNKKNSRFMYFLFAIVMCVLIGILILII